MSLIVPTTQHCLGSVTYKGGPKRWEFLIERFNHFQLMERARNSPFRHFFVANEFQCCGTIIHALLLHKVPTSSDEEIRIMIGETVCRFGKREFGMISGLNFVADYTEKDYLQFTKGRRLVDTYLEGAEKVKLERLQVAFGMCTDREDAWRIGLVYFVEGILLGVADSSFILMELLSLVEVPDNFFRYPFGDTVFRSTLNALQKDMLAFCMNQLALKVTNGSNEIEVEPQVEDDDKDESTQTKRKRNHEMPEKAKKEKPGTAYNLVGWVPCFQYWALETVPQLGRQFSKNLGEAFPRMLSWTIKKGKPPHAPKVNDVLHQPKLVAKAILEPRSAEIEYLRHNKLLEVNEASEVSAAAPVGPTVGPSVSHAASSCLSCHLLEKKVDILTNNVQSLTNIVQSLHDKFDVVYQAFTTRHPRATTLDASAFSGNPQMI